MALRPSYWEWRAELEAECARWRAIATGLGVGCLALVGLVVWTALRPTPVYYLAADGTRAIAGIARADQVPREALEAWAAQLALLIGNVTPATARESYERLRGFLTPALQSQMALQIDADLRTIQERQLGTSFSVKHSRLIADHGGRWTVRVTGQRAVWAGPQRLAEDTIAYDLDIVRGRATSDNPAGLLVDRLETGKSDGAHS